MDITDIRYAPTPGQATITLTTDELTALGHDLLAVAQPSPSTTDLATALATSGEGPATGGHPVHFHPGQASAVRRDLRALAAPSKAAQDLTAALGTIEKRFTMARPDYHRSCFNFRRHGR